MRQKIIAGTIVLTVLGGLASVVAAQAPADTPTNPFSGAAAPAAAAAGRNSFNGVCAACHGQDAAGTERAPSLAGALKHGSEEYEIFQTITKGVPGTQMPAFDALPPEEIWRLVTFIKSLSGTTTAAAAAPAGGPAPAQGDAVAGRQIFFGKGQCSSCHEVQGQGSPIGPDLSAAGSGADLRQRVLHTPAAPAARGGGRNAGPPFQLSEVTLKDGRKLTGLVKTRDSAVTHLQTREGAYQLLSNDKIASVVAVPNSGAPRDLAQRLSAAEVDNLVAYLSRQRGRDFKETIKANPPAVLTYDRLVKSKAEPQNWPTYWGDYAGRHFSDLTQITAANVKQLQLQWVSLTPYERSAQSSPIVVDGIMYTSGAPGDVYAIDARSGVQLWKTTRKQDKRNPYQINPANRGVAVLDGRVFFNTLDNNLVALDAHTGRQLWEVNTADTMQGYTMTGAPLVLKDMVVVGMSGGEGGVLGFLEAYNPATGEKLWRFNTIPAPGEPGSETWKGDSWKTGGGATWLTGSYDPELNLLYWTVGNPGPDFNPHQRPGDNLYTCSVIALDPKTGKLVWHYQFTPNDGHDWDSVQDLVLADRIVDGKPRKVMLHADRNGFFYMLDRTNGKFISANNFVTQTWNDGFDANGRPKVRPESIPTPDGTVTSPAVGGTNFQAPSYDDKLGTFYLAFSDSESFSISGESPYEPGKLFYGRGEARRPAPPPSRPAVQGVMAWDPAKAQRLWTFPLTRGSLQSGVLGTRGGVVFAASSEGWLYGLDAKTGQALWKVYAGTGIAASPMSYAIDGRQYVAVMAGGQVMSFALPQ